MIIFYNKSSMHKTRLKALTKVHDILNSAIVIIVIGNLILYYASKNCLMHLFIHLKHYDIYTPFNLICICLYIL